MGLVKRVFDNVGRLAAEGGSEDLRAYIQRSAYFASQSEGNKQGNDHYWFAALASATLNLLVEREGKDAHPVQAQYASYMNPSEFRTKDPHSEWDAEDIWILKLGFQHHFWCCIDTPKDNFWWTSRRIQAGLDEKYPVKEPPVSLVKPSELRSS
jgi:hypothetical protein